MTKDDAIKHFGTQQALAAAIGVTQGTISGWKAVPPWRQLQIEAVTLGALVAGPECDRYRVPALPTQQSEGGQDDGQAGEAQDSAPGALSQAAA